MMDRVKKKQLLNLAAREKCGELESVKDFRVVDRGKEWQMETNSGSLTLEAFESVQDGV